MNWMTLCRKSDVREDYPHAAQVDGREIGIFLLDGQYYALDNLCPHAEARLSQGFIEEGQVECPLHEARFDLRNGRCTHMPEYGGAGVGSYAVRVQGEDIQVQMQIPLQLQEQVA